MVLTSISFAAVNPKWVVPGRTVSAAPDVLGSESSKFCALTFDDGPDAKYTMQIMEILDANGIDATFFIIGSQAKSRLDQVMALHNSGHEIANHSNTHPDFSKLTSTERRNEFSRLNDMLKPLGITPKWFRPPYGAYNKATVATAANHGLETVLWTLDPKDWSTPGVEKIRQRVVSQTDNGEVILLHSTNAQTVAALPGIIDGLRAKGFEFVTMSIWREIVTGQRSVKRNLQPPQTGPYPIAFAKEQLTAQAVFSHASRAAQYCLPAEVRHIGLDGNVIAKTIIVYSNFTNLNDFHIVQTTGTGRRISAFESNAVTPKPVTKLSGSSSATIENVLAGAFLYYHMGDGDNQDAHDPPEWPRSHGQPEV